MSLDQLFAIRCQPTSLGHLITAVPWELCCLCPACGHRKFPEEIWRRRRNQQQHMASKFLRHHHWWIKFRHPHSGDLIRESLETTDEARAELIRMRVDLEVSLREPRFQALELPRQIQEKLFRRDPSVLPPASPEDKSVFLARERQPAAESKPMTRTPVNEAIAVYLRFIASENAAAHFANKVSILRRFLGSGRLAAAGGPTRSSRGVRADSEGPFFRGMFIDEISAAVIQDFIEGLGLSRKTMRHYRECFHHFFEVCLRFDLYRPTNPHRPNPVAALPSYLTRNQQIVYLSGEQVLEQVTAAAEDPRLQMAIQLMIYAGLRRSEMLWLTRDSVEKDLRFLSVRNKADAEAGLCSSLKTGERTVTILPALRAVLEGYLANLKGAWLIPNAEGKRWKPDHFTKKLLATNSQAGLPWNCLSFRHTFATERASEGWPLFRIAKEMGNSVAIVEQYYAAFIRPDC